MVTWQSHNLKLVGSNPVSDKKLSNKLNFKLKFSMNTFLERFL